MHLYTTLNRLQYNLSVSNPMLHEIKRMYPYMFDMLIHELDDMNQSLSLQIPEEEAAYLTLHFQAAMERLNDKRYQKYNYCLSYGDRDVAIITGENRKEIPPCPCAGLYRKVRFRRILNEK